VFGRRQARAKAMPDRVRAYSGVLPYRDAPEAIADRYLTVTEDAPKPAEGVFTGGSAYRESFRNGATLYPRFLCFIERRSQGRIGSDQGSPYVVSRRNSQEKIPWKFVPQIEGRVEAEFIYPVLLGESIAPFRVLTRLESVLPVTSKGEVLSSKSAANRGFSGLHGWLTRCEAAWSEHGESSETFSEQLNHHGKLASQFPIADRRVVYAKSGTIPAACIVENDDSIIDHMLYWSSVADEREARYLTATLNSETARARVASMQARGQWGARHFDKVMFNLPIPRFDEKNKLHRDLAQAAKRAEEIAAKVALPDNVKFQRARKLIRDALAEAKVSQKIDALVAKLLDAKGAKG
jgi:hypothetical protein